MKSVYYRSGQASKVWGISPHLVRRLCEAGLIAAERTSSGHWKIPQPEVERISREGLPEIPSSIEEHSLRDVEDTGGSSQNRQLAPSCELAVSPEGEFEGAGNDTKITKVVSDSEALRTWSSGQEVEVCAHSPQLSQVRTADPHREQERIAWHDSWMATALRSLPFEAPPEIRLVVRETVSDVLEKLGPEHSWWVIDPLVSAAVAKALRPWNQERETTRAVEMACSLLPWEARSSFSPTTWQSRAREASSDAIRKLPADSPLAQKICVANNAVKQITSDFEDAELRKRIVQGANLADITWGERDNAREAIRQKLEGLRGGTPATALEKAREDALAPFRDSRRRAARVDQALRHIKLYLDRLNRGGEIDFENEWEVSSFARKMEGRLRPVIANELESATISEDDLSELVEELVDEALE